MPSSKIEVAGNEDGDEKYAGNDDSCDGSCVEGCFGITAHRSLRHRLCHRFWHDKIAKVTGHIPQILPGAHFIYVFIEMYQG